jgi:hypothetical protein
MSISDVILGKRHLLGFVIPGAILVLSGVLFFNQNAPYEVFKSLSVAEWFAIAVSGMVAGHAFGHGNFRFTTWLSRAFHKRIPLAIYEEQNWMADKRELVGRVQNVFGAMTEKSGEVKSWSESKLFDHCKLVILEKTKTWAAKLDERETEINLLAMNVVPLVLLLLVCAVKGFWFASSWMSQQVFIPIGCMLFPLLLLRNIQPLRSREREVVFEMFLILPMLSKFEPAKSGSVQKNGD